MKKSRHINHCSFYRKMKTTQEIKKSFDYPELVRAKRNKANLPNAWDDEIISDWNGKSWKLRRKTQWKGRGEKHDIVIDYYEICEWELKEYFEKNNISYDIQYITETKTVKRKSYSKEYFLDEKGNRIKEYVTYRKLKKVDGVVKTSYVSEWLGGFKYKMVFSGLKDFKITERKKTKITWWSNKDIGIQFLLKKFKMHK